MLRELRTKLKNKTNEARKLVELAISENRSVDSDDSYKALNSEIDTIKSQIRALEALEVEEVGEVVEERVHVEPKAKVTNNPEDREWDSLGEMLLAVRNAHTPGGREDVRFKRSQGLNESIGADGGFLVEQQLIPGLIKDTWETGLLIPKTRKITVGANSNGLTANTIQSTNRATGSRLGGIQAYWKGEGQELTKSNFTYGKLEMKLKKLTGLMYATEELMQDTTALASMFEESFKDEFGFMLDDAIFRGTGAGQPQGILNSGALVTVAKETGQSADTIVAENIIKMYARISPLSIPRGAWYINQECMPQLMQLKIDIGTGGQLLYMPANGLSGSPYGTLFGRPVIPLEQSSALGDKGDIMFADLSEYLMIDKGVAKADSSIHVRFLYDETAFKVTYRVDGQTIKSSAVTPYKGSSTISPFVTLAERA